MVRSTRTPGVMMSAQDRITRRWCRTRCHCIEVWRTRRPPSRSPVAPEGPRVPSQDVRPAKSSDTVTEASTGDRLKRATAEAPAELRETLMDAAARCDARAAAGFPALEPSFAFTSVALCAPVPIPMGDHV